MYHVELRQYPQNAAHFNMRANELDLVLLPWARGEWFSMGDLKWNPQTARLTVLEGPHIPTARLSMGRGWRIAQREGTDVTDRLVEAARARVRQGGATAESGLTAAPAAQLEVGSDGAGADLELLADSLGLELLGQLGSGSLGLWQVWRLAAERHPGRPAGETLMLAERAVRSLLARGLTVVVEVGSAHTGQGSVLGAADPRIEALLRTPASWAGGDSAAADETSLEIRRAS